MLLLWGLLQKDPLAVEGCTMVNSFSPCPLNGLKTFMCDIRGCCRELGSVPTFNAGSEDSKEPQTSQGKAMWGCDVTQGSISRPLRLTVEYGC